ncbi:tetratricopeptide repeat protein, partial [bacterium]|nr:tetratricopeptide repeat protein [bacterium]
MAAAALDDSAAVGDRQTYERGLSRYRSRDYPGAIDELDRVVTAPSPDARSLVPSALHHIAQSYRAGGSCGPALTRYEDLLRRFPGYGQAPQAMMEAADC